MAKRYVTITIEGAPLLQVQDALLSIVGPTFEGWRHAHFLGVHIDVSDVSDAVRHGLQFETRDESSPAIAFPVIEVDLYSATQRPLAPLQQELANVLAAGLSQRFQAPIRIREE
jgi:hypothetical protein